MTGRIADTILVTGGTGTTGRRIAQRLLRMGQPVRVASRDRFAASTSSWEHVRFDWADQSTHRHALDGATRLYLLPPVFVADPSPMMLPFLDRALAAGVRRVVLLSSSAISEGMPGVGAVHEAVRERAPEWAVLRPSWFMQNFLGDHHHATTIAADGTIVTSTGTGRVPFVDADDIAEVAARALSADEPHNATHMITGPEPLSYADVAAVLSRVAGRRIRHLAVSPARAREHMIAAGVPELFAGILAGLDEAIGRGAEDRVTGTVERVTGRRPRSFADFAAGNAAAWRGVDQRTGARYFAHD